MNQTTVHSDAARTARFLHLALAGGLALVGVVFLLLIRVSGGPMGDGPALVALIAVRPSRLEGEGAA